MSLFILWGFLSLDAIGFGDQLIPSCGGFYIYRGRLSNIPSVSSADASDSTSLAVMGTTFPDIVRWLLGEKNTDLGVTSPLSSVCLEPRYYGSLDALL